MKMTVAESILQTSLHTNFGCSDSFLSGLARSPFIDTPNVKKSLKEAKRKRKACNKIYPVFLELMRAGKINTYRELETQTSIAVGWFVWFFIKWIAPQILAYLWEHKSTAGY
jgi:hypothetical protein